MHIYFQNSATNLTNMFGELKTEPNNLVSSSVESDFTKKTALDTQLNPPEIKPTEKAEIYKKRKKINFTKSLSKTLSSIVISIRKMF